MSIFLYVGGMRIQNMDYVQGVLSTVSVHGYIYSGEIFLTRLKEDSESKASANLQTIHRYLII